MQIGSKGDPDPISHVHSHLSPDSPRVGRSMSLYYTPNVHRPHQPHFDSDSDNPPRDDSTTTTPQRVPFTTPQDRLRQRQRVETSINDGINTNSIFIFPPPSSSTSPTPSNAYSSPRSPYSEDSIISRPTHRHRDTATSRLSNVSQSESVTDISLDADGISTPTTIVTLSIGSSPGSGFTDIGEGDDERIEAALWDWDDGADEGADGPGGELRRSQGNVRPDHTLEPSFITRSQARPYSLHHGSGERLRALIEHEQLRNRWREISRFQHTQEPRSRSYSPLSTPSNAEVDLLSLAPHPKIRIPFLDFFAFILGVEESTVDLLTRCSTTETHGSVLFPGHTIQPLPAPVLRLPAVYEDDDLYSTVTSVDQRADEGTGLHGFHKALLSTGIERDSWASLKEGLTVLYNTTTSIPTQNPGRLLGLVRLWGLVSHVYARGGKVIRGVYSSTPAPLSGIEELK